MNPSYLFTTFTSFCLLTASTSFLRADEHPLTRIEGTEISLMAADHAVAGSIKNLIVFGSKDEETGTSKLVLKNMGTVTETLFAKLDSGHFGGVIRTEGKETQIELVRMIPDEQKIVIAVNGVDAIITIKADKFENNHFYNPRYEIQIGNNSFTYHFKDGVACYGYSTHLAFWIVGAYVHGQQL